MMKIRVCVGIVLLGTAALALAGCGSGGDPSDFAAAADSVSVMADYTVPVTLQVKALNSFNASITFTADPPPGFTCNPSCTVTTDIQSDNTVPLVFHFDTASSLPGAVTYPIVFHGVEGKRQHDVMASVAVTAFDGVPPPPDFDFTVSPAVLYPSVGRGPFKDDTRYAFTFTRYNHYTGPIAVTAAFDQDTFCSIATCSFVDTLAATQAPFLVSTDANTGRHTIVFTATAGNVTRTASADIIVVSPPPTAGPQPQ